MDIGTDAPRPSAEAGGDARVTGGARGGRDEHGEVFSGVYFRNESRALVGPDPCRPAVIDFAILRRFRLAGRVLWLAIVNFGHTSRRGFTIVRVRRGPVFEPGDECLEYRLPI